MTAPTITNAIHPLLQGFLLCASIIVAVGPQNLFLLRQGLRRQHLFVTALFSTLADVVLITLGVGGLSAILTSNSFAQVIFTLGGALFLLWCSYRAALRARHPETQYGATSSNVPATSVRSAIIITLSYSLLNPAAYLDTLMIIGSKSLFFSDEQRLVFGIGAIAASTFWFFTLTYGVSKLAPRFRSQYLWRSLDVVSACIMLGVSVTLLNGLRQML